MFGARQDHVLVAGNLYSALKHRLRGSPCRTYVSDMKLRVVAAEAFFYPDVMVSCDARDHAAELFLQYPRLIIEVLLAGTSAFDRRAKAAAYRRLPSLREYVLVDIDARRLQDCHETTACRFECLDLELPMAEIFEDVKGS